MNYFIPFYIYQLLKGIGFDTDKFGDDDIFGYYLERRSNNEIVPRSVAFCEYNQNIQQYNQLTGAEIAPLYQQVIDWFSEMGIDINSFRVKPLDELSDLVWCITVNDLRNAKVGRGDIHYVNHGIADKPINHWENKYDGLTNAIIEAINLIKSKK